MDKDKALESVNEIKELMEKSSKFISLSGLAAIMAGIYALVGAYIATQVITPGTHLIVALEIDGYNSLARIGSCCGHCLHPVLLQIQEDRAKNFSAASLTGHCEFLSSDADRRCFMYFHPYARVL